MDKQYSQTRLKLSILYFAILFFIVLFFSIELTTQQFSEYDRVQRFTHDYYSSVFPGIGFGQFDSTIKQLKQNIILNTIRVDAIILIISGLGAYYLSGKTLEPIEKALKQQQTFVADASHELKTPIAAILTEAEVLQRSHNTTIDDYKEFTDSAIEEMNRLTSLTNNLLLIAKGENENFTKKIEIDLHILVDEEIQRFEKHAKKKNVKLISNIPENAQVLFNKDRLTQLLDILIDNAIKYNKENGTVTISYSKNKEYNILTVEDTGIGIPKEHLDHLFDRFYRVSQDRNIKGFGLGLSIAKDIVERSNSKISILSELDKFTRVIVKIPNKIS